jgi:hypothetical protein
VDRDTEENLCRRYIRDDEAGTNIFVGAIKCARCSRQSFGRVLLHGIRQLDRDLGDACHDGSTPHRERPKDLVDAVETGSPAQ